MIRPRLALAAKRVNHAQGALELAVVRVALGLSAAFGVGNISPGFAIVLGVAIVAHYWPKDWYARAQQGFASSPALVQALVLAAVVACIQYVGATGSAPFVYQKF